MKRAELNIILKARLTCEDVLTFLERLISGTMQIGDIDNGATSLSTVLKSVISELEDLE